jgi:hypothetical protein
MYSQAKKFCSCSNPTFNPPTFTSSPKIPIRLPSPVRFPSSPYRPTFGVQPGKFVSQGRLLEMKAQELESKAQELEEEAAALEIENSFE